jgi:activator of 2-hydroxyglutaryl-CoA dehydratase
MGEKGIVYIVTNKAMPDLIKIGITKDNIKSRLNSLSNTSVPYPFDCEYACEIDDYETVEKILHTAFQDFRVNPNREFFKMDKSRVIPLLEHFCISDITDEIDTEINESFEETNIEQENKELTNTQKIRLGFWNELKKYIKDNGESNIKLQKAFPDHWTEVHCGSTRAHVSFVLLLQKNKIATEIIIKDKTIYKKIIEEKKNFENYVGLKFNYREDTSRTGRDRSAIRNEMELDIQNKENWNKAFEYFKTYGEKIINVMKNYI